MQHDDLISPTYVADLLAAAARWPDAVLCFCEMIVQSGNSSTVVRPGELLGDPLSRALTHMEKMESGPFRGLIRGSALDSTAGLRSYGFESFGSFHFLMTELALAGTFRFVGGASYFKRLTGKNLHLKWYDWSEHDKREAWASLAAGEFEIIVPAGASLEVRRGLAETAIERFITPREGRWIFCAMEEGDAAGRADMLRRVVTWLRDAKRFDPQAELGWTWEAFETHMAQRFGFAG
jgi:hypothetical protein